MSVRSLVHNAGVKTTAVAGAWRGSSIVAFFDFRRKASKRRGASRIVLSARPERGAKRLVAAERACAWRNCYFSPPRLLRLLPPGGDFELRVAGAFSLYDGIAQPKPNGRARNVLPSSNSSCYVRFSLRVHRIPCAAHAVGSTSAANVDSF